MSGQANAASASACGFPQGIDGTLNAGHGNRQSGRWTLQVRASDTDAWFLLDGSTDRAEAEALFDRERRIRLECAGGGQLALVDPAGCFVEVVHIAMGERS